MSEISLSNIKNSLPKSKVEFDKMDLWVFYVIRPLSFYVTWVFLKLNISSNKASVYSIFIGFLGGSLLLFENKSIGIIGVILINFWIIMDCVDGNIARFNKTPSKFGEFLDALSGYIFVTLLYLFIGMSIYFNQANILFESERWIYLLLGSICSIACIFPRLIEHKAKSVFGHYQSELTSRSEYSLFYKIGLNIGGMAGLSNPLLIVAFLLNRLDYYLLFYTFLHILIGFYSFVKTLKKTIRL